MSATSPLNQNYPGLYSTSTPLPKLDLSLIPAQDPETRVALQKSKIVGNDVDAIPLKLPCRRMYPKPLIAPSSIPFLQPISKSLPANLGLAYNVFCVFTVLAQINLQLNSLPSASELQKAIHKSIKNPPKDPQSALENLKEIKLRLSLCANHFSPLDLNIFLEKLFIVLTNLTTHYKMEDIHAVITIPTYLGLGHLEKALILTDMILCPKKKSLAIYNIVNCSLRQNKISEATYAAKKIPQQDLQNQAYAKIGQRYLAHKQIYAAQVIAKMITDSAVKDGILFDICEVCLLINRIDLALELTDKMRAPYLAPMIREKALYLYIHNKQLEKALELAAVINYEKKSKAFHAIALAYLLQNNVKMACDIAKVMPKDAKKADLLCVIANYYISQCKLQEANRILVDMPQGTIENNDPIQLIKPSSLDPLTSDGNILSQDSIVYMDNEWNALNSPHKIMLDFYYKVLGSNPFNYKNAGRILQGDLGPWIRDLKSLKEKIPKHLSKNILDQIINELTFAFQVRFAEMRARNQINFLIFYVLRRLHQLPLPNNADMASYGSLMLVGGSRNHQVMYIIKRTGPDTFSMSIINSGAGAPYSQAHKDLVLQLSNANLQLTKLREQILLEVDSQREDQLKIELKNTQSAIQNLENQIKQARIGNLTYTDLTTKVLSGEFFIKLLFSLQTVEDMMPVLEMIEKHLAKPDHSNVSLSGHLHLYQKSENCTVKSVSLAIHERAGSELHKHIKGHVTLAQMTCLSNLIADLTANPQIRGNPELLQTAKLFYEEGRKKLRKRIDKALSPSVKHLLALKR